MPQTFTSHLPDTNLTCYDCGAVADVVWISDGPEDATGYRGDLALCKKCVKKRERKG